jgi:beta-carotene/zeaxanthin 4-ketolase
VRKIRDSLTADHYILKIRANVAKTYYRGKFTGTGRGSNSFYTVAGNCSRAFIDYHSTQINDLIQRPDPDSTESHSRSLTGILVALAIVVAWAISLSFSLGSDFKSMGYWSALPLFVLVTFLYTGLFITAHDAMHGLVAPASGRLNRMIGVLCSTGYALFSFQKLQEHHWQHHSAPASEEDPDFHDGEHKGFWRWYFNFLLQYVTWRQVAGMALVYNLLKYGFGVPDFNLVVLWVVPNLASTLQLFTFGTYLPHREPHGGYDNPHRARSNDYPVMVSLVTCYHFGYHVEHHARPDIPWWSLPAFRQRLLRQVVNDSQDSSSLQDTAYRQQLLEGRSH